MREDTASKAAATNMSFNAAIAIVSLKLGGTL